MSSHRGRVSVVGYVVVAFGMCVVSLVVLLFQTTSASFHRERDRAVTQLAAAAQQNANDVDGSLPSAQALIEGIASQPAIAGLDPAQCDTVMSGLRDGLSNVH